MKRKTWFALALGTLTVLVIALLVLAALPWLGIRSPGFRSLPDGMYLEHMDRTVVFDPVSGYRLTKTLSRAVRIDEGSIEYESRVQGNNQGFFDDQDFYPARPDPHTWRVAVFGDSFSSQTSHRNWPNTVEWLSRETNPAGKIEVLNFSQDACGLANWRNVLVHKVEAEDYQVDLLVFAVFGNDLKRPFMVADFAHYGAFAIGNAGMDPAHWPTSAEAALALVKPLPMTYVVTTEQYDQLLAGQWRPEQEHTRRLGQRLVLKWQAWKRFFASLYHPSGVGSAAIPARAVGAPSPTPDVLTPEQKRLVMDIRAVAQQKHLPVWVVRVPHRDELAGHFPVANDVVQFARLLDARLLDGAEAFTGLDEEQVSALYFPHDGHWSKAGADRFADYMYRELNAETGSGNRPVVPTVSR